MIIFNIKNFLRRREDSKINLPPSVKICQITKNKKTAPSKHMPFTIKTLFLQAIQKRKGQRK